MAKILYNINMYEKIPTKTLNFNKIYDYIDERLKLFKILDFVKFSSNSNDLSGENLNYIIQKMEQSKINNLIGLLQDENTKIEKCREIDDISHWFLRLAYCSEKNNFNYFVAWEVLWFRLRYAKMNKKKYLCDFLNGYQDFRCLKIVSEQEKLKLHHYFNENILFKVNYQEAPLLLSLRKGILKNGMLYFQKTDLIHFLVDKFEKKLRMALKEANAKIAKLDDRISFILSNINLVLPATLKLYPINIDEIDDIAKSDFPLCMRHLHETLRRDHHLKYNGRLQYALFLKDIGVTSEQALKFWQKEFTQKMNEKQFLLKFQYYFKHLYGLVGSCQKYKGNSCDYIQKLNVPIAYPHGCPFKHWDSFKLREKLNGYNLKQNAINEIVELKDEGQYTMACCKYFQSMTFREPERLIQFPIQYYEYSRKIDKIVDIEDLFKDD